jgi:hypothetical protein
LDKNLGVQFGLWLSLVERLPRVQEAAGSNPASPISFAEPSSIAMPLPQMIS